MAKFAVVIPPSPKDLMSPVEARLRRELCELPAKCSNLFTRSARRALLQTLFRSLAGNQDRHAPLFFPDGFPTGLDACWNLRQAQGAVEGAEYTEAARGKPCGHVFKAGDSTYRCRTCSTDDTCVLCSRCFDASDHAGHAIHVASSLGNSGCCDCGDEEAWRIPVRCAIHTDLARLGRQPSSKSAASSTVTQDVRDSIKVTIAAALDYLCDVISCSPEQLRLPKSELSIRSDEHVSRLSPQYYGPADFNDDSQEYAMVVWNDEKHTIHDVQEQVSRACRKPRSFGLQTGHELDDVGRSIVEYGADIASLLAKSRIIEQIKIIVTIRSARDTFREQMCGTIVEWLLDLAGCSVGSDHDLLRETICAEMLRPWQTGSEASNAVVGKSGIFDHDREQNRLLRFLNVATPLGDLQVTFVDTNAPPASDGEEDEDDGDELVDPDGDMEMANDEQADETERAEATYAGYPPPPPPPPPAPAGPWPPAHERARGHAPVATATTRAWLETMPAEIPRTPSNRAPNAPRPMPAAYWMEKPAGYSTMERVPLAEDLWRRVRLDWLILFDLRLWKKARIDLRDLYLTTVVTIPRFKRFLGLRFAGLYTVLAQLYLIADREPEHSIINLSIQMLTSPSITEEVVERGNFLTSLMAILYTFLTTRQVGHPHDVDLSATLAFEAGSLANRRIFHFFQDLRFLFLSDRVQRKLHHEPRYLRQFLDLVKLHQGMCPNLRVVGDHVEYETDAWISASFITRELNRLCRLFTEALRWVPGGENAEIAGAIHETARVTVYHSLGLERARFPQSEIKELPIFKLFGELERETYYLGRRHMYRVLAFNVAEEPISFHHALHYTLSWLIESARAMSAPRLRELLVGDSARLVPVLGQQVLMEPDDALLAMFDFPLRVCVWLAQVKAGLWVRNGLSLRHQMSTYRGVTQRDLAHHRDIFLLQTALVVCEPSRVLATMVDRYGLEHWMTGKYDALPEFDEHQLVDVVEDFLLLLVVLLCDRLPLIPAEAMPHAQGLMVQREIAHVLCFQPLSYSDITARISDRTQEMDDFAATLEQMTTFRAPEGLSDHGTFELRREHLALVDPYVSQYSRNQREEAEAAVRQHAARTQSIALDDVVFHPTLYPIGSGVFAELAAVTRTPLFAHVIYAALRYPLRVKLWHPTPPTTRLEAYLHVVLHLVLIAVLEDQAVEVSALEPVRNSFVATALTKCGPVTPALQAERSIVGILRKLLGLGVYQACHPKVRRILRLMQEKRPETFAMTVSPQVRLIDRIQEVRPPSQPPEHADARKQAALARQARVMASFQQQQQNFLDRQGGFHWGADAHDGDPEPDEASLPPGIRRWKFPRGACIYCQEGTSQSSLFGVFAFIGTSNILRQTNLQDDDFVAEAASIPTSLDRSADAIRPFGVAGQNREPIRKLTADGAEVTAERRALGRGFPPFHTKSGPVVGGCGHIMHYHCFETYHQSAQRRQSAQIARAHPDRLDKNEFLCPLCKALGNIFLPVVWRSREEVYPGALAPDESFDSLLSSDPAPVMARMATARQAMAGEGPWAPRARVPVLTATAHALATRRARPPLGAVRPAAWPASPGSRVIGSYSTASMFVAATTGPRLGQLPVMELVLIYRRLRDSLKVNFLHPRAPGPSGPPDNLLLYTDTLQRSLGFSIAAVEIAQRGVESAPGQLLIDTIPHTTISTLRVLSETISTYIAIGFLMGNGSPHEAVDYTDAHDRQLHQLFVGHPRIAEALPAPTELKDLEPLFWSDSFTFLAECSACLVPALTFDIHNILRLCYLAEVTKVTLAYVRDVAPSSLERITAKMTGPRSAGGYSPAQLTRFYHFIICVDTLFDEGSAAASRDPATARSSDELPLEYVQFVRQIVDHYSLIFLRRAAVLLYIRYGIDLSRPGADDPDQPELARLTKALRLPTCDEMLDVCMSSGSIAAATLQSMISGWIKHWALWRGQRRSRPGPPFLPGTRSGLHVSHPGIFELVALPKTFEVLAEETAKRRCPTTGKELKEPAICLFCGEIFCSQAFCCAKKVGNRVLGGCNQHLAKCGQSVGLFINIRKCTVLSLHHHVGSYQNAPYLDQYGEVDLQLRRTRQLFLNQHRYDALLRTAWLNHSIPSVIARKLEAENNNGGWESI
ncbi:MAG: hypothetical protein M1826_001183 [Phylliscum demangeonii]|nr:MAG: hypothetical protein M1826_001183 [Phylliscum demangeonii]